MRVLVTGSGERAARLAPKLEQGGWDVVSAGTEQDVLDLVGAGRLSDLQAAVILPGDIERLEGDGRCEQLLEFLEKGLLARIRVLSVVSRSVRAQGGCRFVLVGGNVPPEKIPDNQGARAGLMAAAAQAAVDDGGAGCSAKVLGPTATEDDIVAALTDSAGTPMVVWDLPSQEEHLSFGSWRDALLAGSSP